MGEKATASRLSFEAVVALGVLICSVIIHMISCASNTWFWYKDKDQDPEITYTIGVWKEIICRDPCIEDFNIPGWARATAAFTMIALMIHLCATISAFLYVFWHRNKRFMFGTALAIIASGCVKCLSALIFGIGASRQYDGWLDWAFALLLITMSLDWVTGLVSLVEYSEAKLIKPNEHRRGPKNQLGIV